MLMFSHSLGTSLKLFRISNIEYCHLAVTGINLFSTPMLLMNITSFIENSINIVHFQTGLDSKESVKAD